MTHIAAVPILPQNVPETTEICYPSSVGAVRLCIGPEGTIVETIGNQAPDSPV